MTLVRHLGGALGLVGLAACAPPEVEARAVWIHAPVNGEQVRRLEIYDAGERESRRLEQVEAGSVDVRLAPNAGSVLVRDPADEGGSGSSVWLDLEFGRLLRLSLPPSAIGGTGDVRFTPRGDALAWREGGSFLVAPLDPEVELELDDDGVLEPVVADNAAPAWWDAAADAPRIVGSLGSEGLVAWDYPRGAQDPRRLQRVAHATGSIATVLPTFLDVRDEGTCTPTEGPLCGTDVTVEPLGRWVAIRGFADEDQCGFGGWRIGDDNAYQIQVPEEVCGVVHAELLAAFEPGVVLFMGHDHLILVREGSDPEVFPLLGEGRLTWKSVDQGRKVIVVRGDGTVLRADASGIDIAANERTNCLRPTVASISPTGRAVAWACAEDEASPSIAGAAAAVVRVTPAGLDRFAGVPMAVVAVDDEGGVLLYSDDTPPGEIIEEDLDPGVPRTLFALSPSGELERVDDLEPAPEPIRTPTSTGPFAYIVGQPVQ